MRPLPSLIEATGLSRHRIVDALEGIAKALRSVASVHLMCEPSDLETALVDAESQVPDAPEELPTLFVYERYLGGVGYHAAMFESAVALLHEVGELLAGCGCEDGCPSCVGAPAALKVGPTETRSRRVREAVEMVRTGKRRG